MRLLLVEDDEMIGASLVRGLRDEGHVVDWVRDADSAATALADQRVDYSLALLDWLLPKRDGLWLLKMLRSTGNSMPVLMMTARDAVMDRVTGLDEGADDYLVKPFELVELKARVRSLLRRRADHVTNPLSHGELLVDCVTHTVRLRGQPVTLTAREFALVRALIERPGAVLSRAQLEAHLYGWGTAVDSNAVEFIIHGVRKKLGAEAIENVRAVGWRLGSVE